MLGTRDIIVLALILGSVPICFWRPYYGILLWTILSFLNPQQMSWGAARDFPVALVVAVPTLAGALVFCKTWHALRSRETFLILALWVWFTATSLHTSLTPEFADHVSDCWFRWRFVSKILLMALVAIALVNTFDRLRWLLIAIASAFGFFVAKALPWMIATGGQYRLYGPDGTMVGDNNDFGLALNMTLPIFFCLAKTEMNRRLKMIMAGLFVLTIPSVFFTYSRGALIGMALVLLAMGLRMRQRILLVPVICLAAVFATVFTPEKWQQRMDFRQEGALIDSSARSRFNSWTYSYQLALDYPLMGGGFEAYTPRLFNLYAPNPLDVHGPHSIYFGVLAEHGFTGLALYLVLVGSCFASLQKVIREARRRDDDVAANYAIMLELSLLGFLGSGAFLGRAYFDYYFTIVVCVAILKRVCRSAWEQQDEAEPMLEEQLA
jgi:probable O-glycosylation ligase (exosortase A-associated)